MTPLLRHHAAEDLVAFGEGGPKTAADLRADIAKVAAALPDPTPGSHVLVVIGDDRYAFAAALLGSWQRGHAVALPPNQRPLTVTALLKRDDVAALLHDTQAGGHLRIADVLAASAFAPAKALEVPARAATVFTSGTTGASEAWPKTREQLLQEIAVLAEAFSFSGNRFVVTVPPSHLYGLLFGVLVPLGTGGAFIRQTSLQPEAVAARIAEHGADTLVSVPVHLRAAQTVARFEPLQRIFSSTAPLSEKTAAHYQAAHGLAIIEIFGSTETGGIAHRQRTRTESWQPLPGVTAGADSEGRLTVDSPFLPPDSPRPHTTADLADVADDGTFLHRGRVDGVVKIGGVRVSLPAMQRFLMAQEGVDDAEVAAVPAEGRGVRLLAAVASETRTEADLRTALADAFHPTVLPRRFWIGPALPREASGKLPRHRLLQRFGLAPDGSPLVHDLEFGPLHTAGEETSVTVRIPEHYAWFQGHFETYAVLAGAVQLTELILPIVARVRPDLVVVHELKRVKFTGRITPGDTITITLRMPAGERVCDFEIASPRERCSAGRLTFAEP